MNGNDFLFESLDHFFECNMWRGQRSDHKLRRWFQYVYIAAFNGNPEGENKLVKHCQHLKFKIGKAQNLRVRGKALIAESGGSGNAEEDNSADDNSTDADDNSEEDEETEQKTNKKTKKLIKWSKRIVYAFSVPRPLMFETRIKRFLCNFIYKDLNMGGIKVQYASEIVQGVAFEVLVHVIQLCILEGCLYHKYIKLNENEQIFGKHVGDMMKNPPDTIKWKGNMYYGRKMGVHQSTTLEISTNVKKTVELTLNSKHVNNRIDSITLKDDFDLMADVANYTGTSPKFIQYVFDVPKNDNRLNDTNNISDGPSHLSRSTKTEDAPDNSFVVGNLAFATFEKDSDGKFPCEIVGYWNGQFVVRWIDPRRFDSVARTWIEYDSEAHKQYKTAKTLHTLSDFLKDEVVAVGNNYLNDPMQGNRYRDYIELIETSGETKDNDAGRSQPTEVLVPLLYRKVGEEYKNPKQLSTWSANRYGPTFAPSRHWQTGYPNNDNHPINPTFQAGNDEDRERLENAEEERRLELERMNHERDQQRNDDDELLDDDDLGAPTTPPVLKKTRVKVINGKYKNETGTIAKRTAFKFQLKLDSGKMTESGILPMVNHDQVEYLDK